MPPPPIFAEGAVGATAQIVEISIALTISQKGEGKTHDFANASL
jgi:hypothetical protein